MYVDWLLNRGNVVYGDWLLNRGNVVYGDWLLNRGECSEIIECLCTE